VVIHGDKKIKNSIRIAHTLYTRYCKIKKNSKDTTQQEGRKKEEFFRRQRQVPKAPFGQYQ
jgi:hypothetical protein